MPCIPVPQLTPPTLPTGINLAPPLPTLPSIWIANPCCLLPPLQTPQLPFQLPPIPANPTFVALIRAAMASIAAYKLAIPTKCPRG